MKKSIFIINIFILLLSGYVQADYNEMREEYEGYLPPAYFQSQLRPVPESSPAQPYHSFEKEEKRLNAAKTRWEKDLGENREMDTFSYIDTKLLDLLAEAKFEAGAASNILGGKYSIETLEALALLRNPSVESAEKRFRAAIEQFSQIANLDEILRQYSAFTEEVMTGIGPMRGKDPVKMKFPFPGVMALKGQIVEKTIQVAREDLEIARREAITAIRQSFWRLVYIKKALKITQETLTLLRHLEEVATIRYEAGKTSYQDVVKVRINRETLEEELRTIKERQNNIKIKILEILDLPIDVELSDPQILESTFHVPELTNLISLAQKTRQEIRRIRAKVGKMERMVELAETMILPSYTLNLSLYEDEAANQVGSFSKRKSFPVKTSASMGPGLPKHPWFGTNDAYLRQVRQKIAAAKAELKTINARTATMVRQAWFELDRAKREEALFENTVIDLSRTSLDVSTRGYESGKVSFADVFASYDNWLRANLALERKRSDIGIFWAEIERVVGKRLSK